MIMQLILLLFVSLCFSYHSSIPLINIIFGKFNLLSFFLSFFYSYFHPLFFYSSILISFLIHPFVFSFFNPFHPFFLLSILSFFLSFFLSTFSYSFFVSLINLFIPYFNVYFFNVSFLSYLFLSYSFFLTYFSFLIKSPFQNFYLHFLFYIFVVVHYDIMNIITFFYAILI